MNFEEWKDRYYINFNPLTNARMKDTWNAAIDEAVKVVDEGRHSQFKDLTKMKIKHLKEQ